MSTPKRTLQRTRFRARSPMLCGTLLVAATACGADPAGHHAAPVDPGPESLVGGPPPATKSTTSLPPLNTGEANVPEGSFSTFLQLSSPPQSLDSTWRALSLGDEFTTAPALGRQLDMATASLATQTTVQNDIVKLLSEVPTLTSILPVVSNDAPKAVAIAYQPERARWCTEQVGGDKPGQFQDPVALSELRQRGARLYCAAKNAADQQANASDTRIMGKKNLIDFKFLGQHIGLMTVEPTLSVLQPQRFDSGGNDGAQAFLLPFEAGLRVQPVPFLKSLPEIRVPVVALTGDSEVSTAVRPGDGTSSTWTTSTTLMGFGSTGYGAALESPKITLFTVGPVSVQASIGLDFQVASCSEQAGYDACHMNPTAEPGRMLQATQDGANGQLVPAGIPARGMRTGKSEYGWTSDADRGAFPGDFNDGPWTVDTQLWQASIPGSGLAPFQMTLPDPLAARMLQDNDKGFAVVHNLGLSLSLTASGGITFPVKPAKPDDYWLKISADLSGKVTLNSSVVHRFREEEEIQAWNNPIVTPEFTVDNVTGMPLTAFTVTPGIQPEPLDITFSGSGTILLKLPIIGKISKTWNLFKVPLQAGTPGPAEWWTERNRIRMTTMQTKQGQLVTDWTSHLPATLPYGSDTSGCGAAQTAAPTLPPRCGSVDPVYTQPLATPLCFAAKYVELVPDHSDDPALNCYLALQSYVTSGTSMRQTFNGIDYVAHVIDTNADPDGVAMNAGLVACDKYYASQGQSDQLADRFDYIPCDANAQLYAEAGDFESTQTSGALPTYEAQPNCTP